MVGRMSKVVAMAAALAAAGCGGVDGAIASSADPLTPASPCSGEIPARLVPGGTELAFALDATGVQIYTFTAAGEGAAWTFSGPEATLFKPNGNVAGDHHAGPTWRAKDGSTVVGARVDGVTVDPSAIPWLLLRATSHGGEGRMSGVTHVQRVATTGGIGPTGPCSPPGAVEKVPYGATYCFHVEGD